MYTSQKSSLFSGERLSVLITERIRDISDYITNELDSYILNTNETEYVKYLTTKFSFDVPVIYFDQEYVDSYEDDVPLKYIPFSHCDDDTGSIRKSIVRYYIPCSGCLNLLSYRPSTIISSYGGRIDRIGQELVMSIINMSNNIEDIKRQHNSELYDFKQMYRHVLSDIETFNKSIEEKVKLAFDERKKSILEKANVLTSLGVPLKQSNVSQTFSVPRPQLREQIVVKPQVTETGFTPEPTLDDENYQRILKIINDVGVNFESKPSVYKGKCEEDLRDHFLLVLDPNFSMGGATGETFNKSGKTDILLRYDSSAVFVAECKFWKGEKSFLSTIDQLLSYLTWRNSKASVIIFVKQKDFSAVIEKVRHATSKHPNYLGFSNMSADSWFNYRFHITDNRNKEIKLAIQLFHIPSE